MKKLGIMIIAFVLLFWLVNCANENQDVSQAELTESLKEIVSADEIIDLEMLDDGEALPVTYDVGELAKAVGDTFPVDFRQVRFGRILVGKPERNVEITLAETTAIALVTTTMTGKFKVVLIDTVTRTVVDSVSKDFTEITKQKLRLRRVRFTDNPKRDWRIVAVSPIIGRSLDNYLEIQRLRLQQRHGEWALELSNDSSDSLLNYFLDREQLVSLKAQGVYDIAVTVDKPLLYHDLGELVTTDFGIGIGLLKCRRYLTDEDHDHVYTGIVSMHGRRSPMCRLAVNVISAASIFVKSEPVVSTFWIIPYWTKS